MPFHSLLSSVPSAPHVSQTPTGLVDVQKVSLSTLRSCVAPTSLPSRLPRRQMDFLCYGDALWWPIVFVDTRGLCLI